MKDTNFEPYYVIARQNKKTGKQEYKANDTYSGGYPYWTDNLALAVSYTEYPKICKWALDSFSISKDWEVVVLELQTVVLMCDNYTQAEVTKLKEKLEELEKEKQKIQSELEQLIKH